MSRLILGGVALIFLANWVICCSGGTPPRTTSRGGSPSTPAKLPATATAASSEADTEKPFPTNAPPEEIAAREAGRMMRGLNAIDAKYLANLAKERVRDRNVYGVGNFVTIHLYKVLQVTGSNEMLAKVRDRTVAMVTNTSGIVDDSSYEPKDKIWYVVKTARYATVSGGTNQVYVLAPVDTELVAKIDAKLAEAKQLKADRLVKEEYERTRWREFADKSGTFKIVAEFKQFKGGKVHLLRKDNGEVITLELSKLSDADQKWIRAKFKR